MRMSRINLGMLVASLGSMGSAMAFSGSRIGADYDFFGRELKKMRRVSSSKPNKLSQKKRRLNARRMGKNK